MAKDWTGENNIPHDQRVANPRYQDSVMKLLKDAARDTVLIPPNSNLTWKNIIGSGSESPIVGLLFSRLCHLQ